MKKNIIFFIIIIFVLSISICFAANPKVQLNGKILDFTDSNGNKVEAQIINNRTMVPLRKIFEELGCKIEWDGSTKTVTAKKDDIVIKLTVGNNNAVLSNIANKEQNIVLDSAPVIVENRTLVPLRFIGESLGNSVGWDSKNSTAIIVDFDEIAQIIKEKCSFLYENGVLADLISIEDKYFDDSDASRNSTTNVEIKSSKIKDGEREVNFKFSGNSDIAKEIETEEWNNFSCNIDENSNLETSNYAFSKMLGIKKGVKSKIHFEDYGLSKENATSLKEWISLVSNINSSSFNTNTYNELKNDWTKFVNTFLSGSKALTRDDFKYTYIDFSKLFTTRMSEAISGLMLLNNSAFKISFNFDDLLSDYPTVNYSVKSEKNSFSLTIKLKNEYKERKEITFTLQKMNSI